MKILKFGGTSMGNTESLEKVSNIIQENFKKNIQQVIICSAMSGVTDSLFAIGDLAEKGHLTAALKKFKIIKKRHFEVAKSFQVAETFRLSIDPVFSDLENLIKGLALIKELSPRSKASLTSFGERLSSRLLTEILKTKNIIAIQQDSDFIQTTGNNIYSDEIDWEKTKKNAKKVILPLLQNNQVPIVTGFFGKNPTGNIALLGRGGSDFSASIMAHTLEWKIVEIWTDVDGFLSADPRIVPEAKIIPEIGYTEISELCFFGAKVLHPKTIRPIIETGGEVWIKNTFSPKGKGTRIIKKTEKDYEYVLSIASKEVIMVALDIFGAPFAKNKVEVLQNMFSITSHYKISIDVIASSEAQISFCFEAIDPKEQKAFIEDLTKIVPTVVYDNRTVIAVVSSPTVRGQIGYSTKIFSAISEARCNLEMYSQNASEISQLLVVKKEDAQKAIKSIHTKMLKVH